MTISAALALCIPPPAGLMLVLACALTDSPVIAMPLHHGLHST